VEQATLRKEYSKAVAIKTDEQCNLQEEWRLCFGGPLPDMPPWCTTRRTRPAACTMQCTQLPSTIHDTARRASGAAAASSLLRHCVPERSLPRATEAQRPPWAVLCRAAAHAQCIACVAPASLHATAVGCHVYSIARAFRGRGLFGSPRCRDLNVLRLRHHPPSITSCWGSGPLPSALPHAHSAQRGVHIAPAHHAPTHACLRCEPAGARRKPKPRWSGRNRAGRSTSKSTAQRRH
jgi:hypothetical protein